MDKKIKKVIGQWAEARGNRDCLFNLCIMEDGEKQIISDEFPEGEELLDEYWGD